MSGHKTREGLWQGTEVILGSSLSLAITSLQDMQPFLPSNAQYPPPPPRTWPCSDSSPVRFRSLIFSTAPPLPPPFTHHAALRVTFCCWQEETELHGKAHQALGLGQPCFLVTASYLLPAPAVPALPRRLLAYLLPPPEMLSSHLTG